jgi:hypothetical protein
VRDVAALRGTGVANTEFDPLSPVPFPLNNFLPVAINQPQAWPPLSKFNTQDFDQQAGTRQGSGRITGLGVHINQTLYDDDLQNAGAPIAGNPVYPMCMNIGCRVRATNAGSGNWWWRPGAPVGLVLDTITPALVHELARPIVLQPGDSLEVSLEPVRTTVIPLSPPVTVNPITFLGISFNGYASIEG